jgi:hypothetical protein
MDGMECQLSRPKNEDYGDRHGDEKLDHRKAFSFRFLESEKKKHFVRPSIAETFARDVPSYSL